MTTKPTDPPVDDPAGDDDDPDNEPVEATREELLEQLRKKDQENVKIKTARKADARELERLTAIEDEHKDDQQKAIDAAVKEATDQVKAEARTQLLAERIMRRATGKLADPSDVILIDFTAIEDADDEKAIDEAIDALLEAKPHLAATDHDPNVQQPNTFPQGPRGRVTTKKPTEGEKAEAWLRGQMLGQ